jgi:oxygen-independent coproporphyrinogen-3 oxidase
MMNRKGVYIHIPFCRRKCLYCDFPSRAGQNGFFEAYKNAVLYEIDHSTELAESEIDSVFFGGGTPTVMPPEYLAEILARVFQYNVVPDAEITVEANPGPLTGSRSVYCAGRVLIE